MNKEKFNEVLEKYYSLNEQIKKMDKLRKKLNDEIKKEMLKYETMEFENVGYISVMSEKEKRSLIKDKVEELIIENNKKLDDYYKVTKYYTLNVMKKETTLRMEAVDV